MKKKGSLNMFERANVCALTLHAYAFREFFFADLSKLPNFSDYGFFHQPEEGP